MTTADKFTGRKRLSTLVVTRNHTDVNVTFVENRKEIDYNNRSDRQWLATHTLWALDNKRSIQLSRI